QRQSETSPSCRSSSANASLPSSQISKGASVGYFPGRPDSYREGLVGDYQQRRSPAKRGSHSPREAGRIERTESFIQQHQVGTLEQGASEEHETLLAVGELPTGLTHDLMKARWHPLDEWCKTQFKARLV